MDEEIRRLAAQMLPDLIAKRFEHGRGQWTDDQFAAWSVELANKLFVESVRFSGRPSES